MNNNKDKDINKIVEELANQIPGFIGYDNVSNRYNSEKAYREYVTEILQSILDDLRRMVVFTTKTLTQDKMIFIEQILFKADKAIRILKRDSEVPSKFIESEISVEFLHKLINKDYKILKLTKRIRQLIDDIYSKGILHPDALLKLKMISEGLGVLLSDINSRYDIMKEATTKISEENK